MKLRSVVAIVICAAQVVLAQAAFAETFTFRFRSAYPTVVNFEIYASARRHVWPGGGKVYTLRDNATHSVKIACLAGEKLCYGAWVRNSLRKQWGASKGGKGGCERCCYRCEGGQSPVLVVN